LAYILAKAEMLVALDRPEEAVTLLKEKVVYFEHSAAIRDAVGQLLAAQGRYAEAVDMLRQGSILASEDNSVREHLALALYYAGQYREAADVLSRLLKDVTLCGRADLYSALGECQLHMGRLREARASLETAASLDASSAGVWLSLAKVALRSDDLKRGELSLKKALTLEPGLGEANLVLGYLRLRQGGRLGDALEAFRKASALDQGDTLSLCMAGYVLEKMDRADQAVTYYARALKINPRDELATQLMAHLEMRE
jgi:tetratricopeptide (TPR) repeat protein